MGWEDADSSHPCGTDSLDPDELAAATPWHGVQCTQGHVTRLELPNNGLDGVLPEELSLIPHLRVLDVSQNTLSGTLPPAYGELNELETLDVHSNQIQGAIPASYGRLNQLSTVNFFWNQLTGTVPAEIAQLALQECALGGGGGTLSTNRFTCPLPEGVSDSCVADCDPSIVVDPAPPSAPPSPLTPVFPPGVTSESGLVQQAASLAENGAPTGTGAEGDFAALGGGGTSEPQGGVVAGIVVGVLVALAIFVACVFKRRLRCTTKAHIESARGGGAHDSLLSSGWGGSRRLAQLPSATPGPMIDADDHQCSYTQSRTNRGGGGGVVGRTRAGGGVLETPEGGSSASENTESGASRVSNTWPSIVASRLMSAVYTRRTGNATERNEFQQHGIHQTPSFFSQEDESEELQVRPTPPFNESEQCSSGGDFTDRSYHQNSSRTVFTGDGDNALYLGDYVGDGYGSEDSDGDRSSQSNASVYMMESASACGAIAPSPDHRASSRPSVRQSVRDEDVRQAPSLSSRRSPSATEEAQPPRRPVRMYRPPPNAFEEDEPDGSGSNGVGPLCDARGVDERRSMPSTVAEDDDDEDEHRDTNDNRPINRGGEAGEEEEEEDEGDEREEDEDDEGEEEGEEDEEDENREYVNAEGVERGRDEVQGSQSPTFSEEEADTVPAIDSGQGFRSPRRSHTSNGNGYRPNTPRVSAGDVEHRGSRDSSRSSSRSSIRTSVQDGHASRSNTCLRGPNSSRVSHRTLTRAQEYDRVNPGAATRVIPPSGLPAPSALSMGSNWGHVQTATATNTVVNAFVCNEDTPNPNSSQARILSPGREARTSCHV
jgi:hypothetical protein